MTSQHHPRVVGFGLIGDPDCPTVCVRVQVGLELGIWIGRPWPGDGTYVLDDTTGLRPAGLEEVRQILEVWPATRGRAADAIQAAAWHGRRELLPAQLRARVTGRAETL